MTFESNRPRSARTFEVKLKKQTTLGWMLAASLILPQLGFGAESLPLSPRNANYEIEVQLEPDGRTLTGRQVLSWRNIQDQATAELWFHLYWNGWRNDRSTWMEESGSRGRRGSKKKRKDDDWGYMVVNEVRVLGMDPAPLPKLDPPTPSSPSETPAPLLIEPLTLKPRFESPDDGNPEDRTVMVVDLPRTVAPGETVRVELTWRAQIPRTFARTGVRGDFYFIAHWFPKLGVFEGDGWNCHQFHAATEFFSDYGVYDVRLTLPDSFVVGATGRRTEERDRGDGTVTHRFQQADVHAFTWTASPHYREKIDRFEEDALPPVDIRLLYQPEHENQVERHIKATQAALKYYGTWYGPYPYGHVTVIDPAWRSGAGGMEYPTLFTAGTGLFRPSGGGSPEGVTVHEAGHQFWYGIVGNNEFEHAWIDEGFNTFSTARTMEAAYGDSYYTRSYFDPPGKDFGGFIRRLFKEVPRGRFTTRWGRYVDGRADQTGPPSEPSYQAYPGGVGNLSYAKTALWLGTLERHLGWETLQEVLSTFFTRYQFKHPKPEDFFAVAGEVTGEDLSWFFDQVWDSAVRFDYAVVSVKAKPASLQGFREEKDGGLKVQMLDEESGNGEEVEAEVYRNQVLVRRLGAGVFPVDVLLVFENGNQERLAWDGRDRWKTFVVEGPSKLDYAVVDPERVLLLDIDYSNNSRLRKSRAKAPARKWASKWMVYLQDLLITFSFFS